MIFLLATFPSVTALCVALLFEGWMVLFDLVCMFAPLQDVFLGQRGLAPSKIAVHFLIFIITNSVYFDSSEPFQMSVQMPFFKRKLTNRLVAVGIRIGHVVTFETQKEGPLPFTEHLEVFQTGIP